MEEPLVYNSECTQHLSTLKIIIIIIIIIIIVIRVIIITF